MECTAKEASLRIRTLIVQTSFQLDKVKKNNSNYVESSSFDVTKVEFLQQLHYKTNINALEIKDLKTKQTTTYADSFFTWTTSVKRSHG